MQQLQISERNQPPSGRVGPYCSSRKKRVGANSRTSHGGGTMMILRLCALVGNSDGVSPVPAARRAVGPGIATPTEAKLAHRPKPIVPYKANEPNELSCRTTFTVPSEAELAGRSSQAGAPMRSQLCRPKPSWRADRSQSRCTRRMCRMSYRVERCSLCQPKPSPRDDRAKRARRSQPTVPTEAELARRPKPNNFAKRSQFLNIINHRRTKRTASTEANRRMS